MSTPTLILRDDLFLEHDPGPGHPENAARLAAVYRDLDAAPPADAVMRAPRPVGAEALERVHSAAYLATLRRSAGKATRFDADTATSARSVEAALAASGAAVEGVEAVVRGEAHGAFALVRPPGHHAETGRAMGFCLLNNVAVAAAHAVAALGCKRVLILDPDVHHGNGTQHAFEERADVLYVSSHRFPYYPGTGAVDEVGRGPGAGYTVNLPVPAGTADIDLAHLYWMVVDPVVRAWQPDLILVSAGFDTFVRDPLGGLAVTERGFRALFALFRSWADAFCPGRLVCVLEGGYDPAGVTLGVRAALEAMEPLAPSPPTLASPVSTAAREVQARATAALAPFWAALRA